jgi:hypothetical protein
MNRSIALVAVAILAIGAGGCQGSAEPAAKAAASNPAAAATATPAPALLDVVCGKNGTIVVPSRIVAAPDGVHARVRDESGYRGVYLNFRFGDRNGPGGGDPVRSGTSTRVLLLPPGKNVLGCSHDLANKIDAPITVEVLDPAGHWKVGVLGEMGCTPPQLSIIDWIYDPGNGSTADEALADLSRQFKEPVTAELVQDGYIAAARQAYVLSKSGRPWATATVEHVPGGYSAGLGSLCGQPYVGPTPSSALLGAVVVWAFAGLACAGHDGEELLQLTEHGVEGQAGASAFGSWRSRVQKAWARTVRVTWRCQPT